jgi:cytochrome c oxidase subunit 3/cytochrome o ubiquinol oxidase subunit 3
MRENSDVTESHITTESPDAADKASAEGAERAAQLQPPPIAPYRGLTGAQWGMIAFLVSEASFFSTLLMVYIVFLGADAQPGGRGGKTPAEVLSLNLVVVTTICLLSSSVTIHLAERELRRGGEVGFRLWWTATILLGLIFLAGTAYEWRELIRQGLTVQRNLFGTTYYTLVGFHGVHVTVGVIVMLIMLGLALGRQVTQRNPHGVELVSWYWHFVDGVWVVVFTVVYLVGR